MPSGAVHQDDGVGASGDMAADLLQVHLHGGRVGPGQHEGCACAPCGADPAEQVGVAIPLIGRQARSCPPLGPDTGAAVLLAQSGFVLEPDLDTPSLGQMTYMRLKRAREVFLNASMTAGSCWGCCGRPVICENANSSSSRESDPRLTFTSNRSFRTRCKSIRRQRTTPWTAQSGPVSTNSASACI